MGYDHSLPAEDHLANEHLEEWLAQFEAARADDPTVTLHAFLPDRGHPLYADVLHELIRVDLEFGWNEGRPRSLEQYRRLYPDAFIDFRRIQGLAFEEYRLRIQQGQTVRADEYARQFGIDVSDWPAAEDLSQKDLNQPKTVQARPLPPPPPGRPVPAHIQVDVQNWGCTIVATPMQHALLREIGEADPVGTARVASAMNRLPEIGEEFLGFRIVGQLGRGAFGRVYLAEQRDLSDRLVALKISARRLDEAQVLARLLHSNIVPIYSVHTAGGLQALCMPYLGSTTLADILATRVGRQVLPESGNLLVHTLEARRQSTRTGSSSSTSPKPPSDNIPGETIPVEAPEVPSCVASTVILERLKRLSYVEAVLWLASRLADGLGHAHERGILHRDLKPANILLTDEGQPMLLDFNLAVDMNEAAAASAARLGGTLPYMSPEQLRAVRDKKVSLGPPSDLYALGIILYELLTGRYPFPIHMGSTEMIVRKMLADREKVPSWPEDLDTTVTPAVRAIVERCLAPDPVERYATARELQEDIQRHLEHKPLKYTPEPSLGERLEKWSRRHPRLSSTTTIGLASAVALVSLAFLLLVFWQRARQAEAADHHRQFADELRAVQLLTTEQSAEHLQPDEPLRRGAEALNRYGYFTQEHWDQGWLITSLPAAEQARLREEVGLMVLLVARLQEYKARDEKDPMERDGLLSGAFNLSERAIHCWPEDSTPRTLFLQQANVVDKLRDPDAARALRQKADSLPYQSSDDRCLAAADHVLRRQFHLAKPLLQEVTQEDPQNLWAWFLLARCHDDMAQDAAALACYNTCISLWPHSERLYFNRGLVQLRLRNPAQAEADFTRVIGLKVDHRDAYYNRGLTRHAQEKYPAAIADFTQALDQEVPYTRAYFMRARAREKVGDVEGAKQDRAQGFKREPTDAISYVARGTARMTTEPQAALQDFERALELNPRYRTAMENQAHVLAEIQHEPAKAIAVLDRLIDYYPDLPSAWAGRGVLRARQGEREAAVKDAEEALRRGPNLIGLHQIACIYALTSRQTPTDRAKALALVADLLRQNYNPTELTKDPDLEPIQRDPQFERMIEAARTLRRPAPSGGKS